MSRSGVEAKPRWQEVPRAVRAEVEAVLGARVVRASRVFGGFAPSATFRMRLSDGRAAFFKGVSATSNEFMRRALPQEERVYRELTSAIAPLAPAFLGSIRHGDWHAILLEDLGPADVPPWTQHKVRVAARAFAEFHRANEGRAFPEWVPSWRALLAHEATIWGWMLEQPERLTGPASLAGDQARRGNEWLRRWAPRLHELALRLHDGEPPYTLLYLDARADNVRVRRGLRVFDWNWVAFGPSELDIASFAEGIAADAGPQPELFVDEYRRHRAVDEPKLDAAVAALAGFFTQSASRPPPPDLPRVRSIQRRQMKVLLGWAARRFDLPAPDWASAVPD